MDLIDKAANRFLPIKKIWGVHIWENSKGEFTINAVLVEYKKGLIFTNSTVCLNNIEQLFTKEFRDYPIALSFDSPKVLMKKVSEFQISGVAEQLHIHNIDDFFIQTEELTTGYFVYAIRRDSFQEILDKLSDKQLNIISKSFGAVNFQSCISFLKFEKEFHVFDILNYKIRVENENIGAIERLREPIGLVTDLALGGEVIANHNVIPYCNALSVFLFGDHPPSIANQVFNSTSNNFIYENLLKKIIPTSLGVILTILFVNFLLLQYYTSNQTQLSQEYEEYQMAHKKLEKLKEQFNSQKNLMNQVDFQSDGCFSYYADKIASLIKGRVHLTALVINPYSIKVEKMEPKIMILNGSIEIKGSCQSPLILSEWISDLKTEEFVKSIQNQIYEFDEIEKRGVFSFRINISNL